MELFATHTYPPQISEIREKCVEYTVPHLKDQGEAWGEVQKAISQYGYYRQEPKGNTVMKIENHVMRPYICYDCTKITTAGATTEDWIALGYVIPDNKGSWKYISKLGYSADDPEVRYPVEVNASSSNGYADGCYTEDLEKAGDGQREVLGSGALDHGTLGGRRDALLSAGLGGSWWRYAARLSACGRCGRRAAA